MVFYIGIAAILGIFALAALPNVLPRPKNLRGCARRTRATR